MIFVHFVFGSRAQSGWELNLTKFILSFSSIVKRKVIKRVEKVHKKMIMKIESQISKEENEDMEKECGTLER